MPYVNENARRRLSEITVLFDNPKDFPSNAGELNYLITRLVDAYLREKGFCYATVNAVVGAMECAKLELYRRLAAPYEDQKIRENGDVYDV